MQGTLRTKPAYVAGAPQRPAPTTLTAELVTASQVAKLLSISPRTVWRLLERGELPPPIRYNRKLVRWHLPTLLRFIDEQAAGYTTY